MMASNMLSYISNDTLNLLISENVDFFMPNTSYSDLPLDSEVFPSFHDTINERF